MAAAMHTQATAQPILQRRNLSGIECVEGASLVVGGGSPSAMSVLYPKSDRIPASRASLHPDGEKVQAIGPLLAWHHLVVASYDYVPVLDDRHLHRVVAEYVPPRALIGGSTGRRRCPPCALPGNVVALPVLGGLHHDYRRVA
jgi:hypothetical protein